MTEMAAKLSFASDYMEGAHPAILQRLVDTNLVKSPGYGLDAYCESAKAKIRVACNAPNAEVHFLVGGTQANATVIDALLKSYQGVIAADTGHIATHEAGAIEFGGHKVLALPNQNGKVAATQIDAYLNAYQDDATREHIVMPGMVYISHPTEYGTLYSHAELSAISDVCHKHGIPLYLDSARLAYALVCPENDVTLSDLAELCDAFYIGGTKCGTLFGEAVVTKPGLIPHFFTIIKQHGALLAKGRLLGLQFDALFTDGLYEKIGRNAIQAADRLREILRQNGLALVFDSPTNQVFCVIENARLARLMQQVDCSVWEKLDETRSIVRFVTNWATDMADVEALNQLLDA